MYAFLDFEASSLGERSYPIEVAWVLEDGTRASHLIRPAPDWTDWDPASEAIHGITREMLDREGGPADAVARHMLVVLDGHDLLASAPSWDGKWLSRLLRAAGLPRHRLRLRGSEQARIETARAMLAACHPPAVAAAEAGNVEALVALRFAGRPVKHRALADAEQEHAQWLAVREAARALARCDEVQRAADQSSRIRL